MVRRQCGVIFQALPSPKEALHFGQSFADIGMIDEQFGHVPIGPDRTGSCVDAVALVASSDEGREPVA